MARDVSMQVLVEIRDMSGRSRAVARNIGGRLAVFRDICHRGRVVRAAVCGLYAVRFAPWSDRILRNKVLEFATFGIMAVEVVMNLYGCPPNEIMNLLEP